MKMTVFTKSLLFKEGSQVGIGHKVTFSEAVREHRWNWVVILTRRWLIKEN